MAKPGVPITREEMYLAAATGETVTLPTPITRKEMYLDAIAQNGGIVSIELVPSDPLNPFIGTATGATFQELQSAWNNGKKIRGTFQSVEFEVGIYSTISSEFVTYVLTSFNNATLFVTVAIGETNEGTIRYTANPYTGLTPMAGA